MDKAQTPRRNTRELSSDQITAEIEQTRGEMDRTVDELSERLHLHNLLDTMVAGFKSDSSQVGSAARDAGKWVLQTLARHPGPIALVGAGAIWLVMEIKSEGEEEPESELAYEPQEISGAYPMSSESEFQKSLAPGISEEMTPAYERQGQEMTEHAKGRLESSRERVSQAAGRISEWSREKWHHLKSRGRETEAESSVEAEQARARAQQRRAKFRQRLDRKRSEAVEFIHEYPLAIGISVLAVGLFVGLLLPASRRERRVLGRRAKEFKEKARQQAERLIERGKEVVQSTAEAAKEEARQQGLTAEGLKESATRVMQEAGESVQEEGLTPEGMGEKVESVTREARETLEGELQSEEERPS